MDTVKMYKIQTHETIWYSYGYIQTTGSVGISAGGLFIHPRYHQLLLMLCC